MYLTAGEISEALEMSIEMIRHYVREIVGRTVMVRPI